LALQIFAANDIGAGVRAILGGSDDATIFDGVTLASTTNAAITATGAATTQFVSIFGTVLSPSDTISLGDDPGDGLFRVYIDVDATVASTGSSSSAILVEGVATIENKGLILADGIGIEFAGGLNLGFSTVINSGLIDTDGVAILFNATTLLSITNTGRIFGRTGTTIDASAATGFISLVNPGEIIGGVDFGSGSDFYLGSGRISTSLNGGAGNDVLTGGENHDRFFGGADNDTLTGNGDNDWLVGSGGIDLLDGGRGDDLMNGGTETDTLIGGLGRDDMTGGAGIDFFVFNVAPTAANRDTIADFVRVDDTMRLENAIFKGIGGNGVLAASMFKLSTQAKDANDRIIYNKATGAVAFDADGSGAKKAVVFAILENKPVINNADFVVI
jgi:Ca2+-binding RTX toxin-like protein